MQRSERYTAYWDLATLFWIPLAGALMVVDYPLWPLAALIGGATYLDTAGREAAKDLSFRHEGALTGTDRERQIYSASYIAMAVIAVAVIVYSILPMVELL